VSRRRDFTSVDVTMLPPWGEAVPFDFQPRTPHDAVTSVPHFPEVISLSGPAGYPWRRCHDR
jgi:hypothetical protein